MTSLRSLILQVNGYYVNGNHKLFYLNLPFAAPNDTFSSILGLCKKLAEEATKGDLLAKHIFEEAGKVLAMHISALSPKMADNLQSSLSIVCIGSVWKSWNLLKEGFVKELSSNVPSIKSYSLLKLKVPMATGACYMAAQDQIVRKYEENTEVFFKN